MFVGQDTTTEKQSGHKHLEGTCRVIHVHPQWHSLKDGKTQPFCINFWVTHWYTMSSKQVKIKLEKMMNWFKTELVKREMVPLICSTVSVSTNQDSRSYWVSTTFQSPASCFEISTGMVFCLLEPLKGKAEKPPDTLPNFLVNIRHENKCFCFPFLVNIRHENKCFCFPKSLIPNKYHFYCQKLNVFSS